MVGTPKTTPNAHVVPNSPSGPNNTPNPYFHGQPGTSVSGSGGTTTITPIGERVETPSHSGGGSGAQTPPPTTKVITVTGTKDTSGKPIPQSQQQTGVYTPEGQKIATANYQQAIAVTDMQGQGGLYVNNQRVADITSEKTPSTTNTNSTASATLSYPGMSTANPTFLQYMDQQKSGNYFGGEHIGQVQKPTNIIALEKQSRTPSPSESKAPEYLSNKPLGPNTYKPLKSEAKAPVSNIVTDVTGDFSAMFSSGAESFKQKTQDIRNQPIARIGNIEVLPIAGIGYTALYGIEKFAEGATDVVLHPVETTKGVAKFAYEFVNEPIGTVEKTIYQIAANPVGELSYMLGQAKVIELVKQNVLSKDIAYKYLNKLSKSQTVNLVLDLETKGQKQLAPIKQQVGIVTEGFGKQDLTLLNPLQVKTTIRAGENYKYPSLSKAVEMQKAQVTGFPLSETTRTETRISAFRGKSLSQEQIKERIQANPEFKYEMRGKTEAQTEMIANERAAEIYKKSVKEMVYSKGNKTLIISELPREHFAGIKVKALEKKPITIVQMIDNGKMNIDVYKGERRIADVKNVIIEPGNTAFAEPHRIAAERISAQPKFGDMETKQTDFLPVIYEKRFRELRTTDITGKYRLEYGAKTELAARATESAEDRIQQFEATKVKENIYENQLEVEYTGRASLSNEKARVQSSIEFLEGGEPINKPFEVVKESSPQLSSVTETYRTSRPPFIKVEQINQQFGQLERKGTAKGIFQKDYDVMINPKEVKISKNASGDIISFKGKVNKNPPLKDILQKAPEETPDITKLGLPLEGGAETSITRLNKNIDMLEDTQAEIIGGYKKAQEKLPPGMENEYKAQIKVIEPKTKGIQAKAENLIRTLESKTPNIKSFNFSLPQEKIQGKSITATYNEIKNESVVKEEPIIKEQTKNISQPVVQPIVQPVTRPVTQPIVQPIVRPVTQPIVRPIVQPIVRPITQPIVQPIVRPVVRPITTQRTTSIVRTPTTTKTPPLFPGTKEKKKKKSELFGVFIRRKGKFKQVAVTDNPVKAEQIGESGVKNTAAASFKVKNLTSGQIVSGITKGQLNAQQFYESKKEPGVFIQKNQFRISSRGEKHEIPGKAQIINRKSKRGVFSL